MGCHSLRHQRVVADEGGQGTVEYAVVTAGVLCVVLALGALWRLFSSGLVTGHGLLSASHHMQGALGWVADIFSY